MLHCITNIAYPPGNDHDYRTSRRPHRTTGRADHRRPRPGARARPRRHPRRFLQAHQPATRHRHRPGALDPTGPDCHQPDPARTDPGDRGRKSAGPRPGKHFAGRGDRPLRAGRPPRFRRGRRGSGGHRGTTLRHPPQRQDRAKSGRQGHHRRRARPRYAAAGGRYRGSGGPRLRRHQPRTDARLHHQPAGRTGGPSRPHPLRFQPRRKRLQPQPRGRLPYRMRSPLAGELQADRLHSLGSRSDRATGAGHHAHDQRSGDQRRPVGPARHPCGAGRPHRRQQLPGPAARGAGDRPRRPRRPAAGGLHGSHERHPRRGHPADRRSQTRPASLETVRAGARCRPAGADHFLHHHAVGAVPALHQPGNPARRPRPDASGDRGRRLAHQPGLEGTAADHHRRAAAQSAGVPAHAGGARPPGQQADRPARGQRTAHHRSGHHLPPARHRPLRVDGRRRAHAPAVGPARPDHPAGYRDHRPHPDRAGATSTPWWNCGRARD